MAQPSKVRKRNTEALTFMPSFRSWDSRSVGTVSQGPSHSNCPTSIECRRLFQTYTQLIQATGPYFKDFVPRMRQMYLFLFFFLFAISHVESGSAVG
jgi:hypothetical protein